MYNMPTVGFMSKAAGQRVRGVALLNLKA